MSSPGATTRTPAPAPVAWCGAALKGAVMQPAIIEAALTTNPARTAAAPTSPEEIVEQGLACIDAGASIVHMHIPDLQVSAPEATEHTQFAD